MVEAVVEVEAEAGRDGATGRERRCHPSSFPLGAKLPAHAVRCRWHGGNRLHRVLDAVFREDLSRLRSGAGPQDMATVRPMAMSLLRAPKDQNSPKVRRKSAAWDADHLEQLLRQPE